MITIINRAKALQRYFEAMTKVRVNSTLVVMGHEKVEEQCYSHEALCVGPSAWSWRKTTQDSANKAEIETPLHRLDELREKSHKQGAAINRNIGEDAA